MVDGGGVGGGAGAVPCDGSAGVSLLDFIGSAAESGGSDSGDAEEEGCGSVMLCAAPANAVRSDWEWRPAAAAARRHTGKRRLANRAGSVASRPA